LHGKLLRIVGALNGAHIFGTLVPVEEPSTASIATVCTAANSARLYEEFAVTKVRRGTLACTLAPCAGKWSIR
jgi:hypothetical protein